MNVEEAAHALRVHRQTLVRLIVAGRLRAVRLGREWRIHRSEIDRFLLGDGAGPEGNSRRAPVLRSRTASRTGGPKKLKA